MPKRWNPLRATAWGGFVGTVLALIQRLADLSTPLPLAQAVGFTVGTATAVAFVFGISAVLRNWAAKV